MKIQHAILSVISFFIGILLVELTLQIYGLYLDSRRHALIPEFEGKIRILALGESTTDELFIPGTIAWTKYLENHLNSQHPSLKFAVINKGRLGAHTGYLVEKLPQQLKEYNPHLVIVMMGINDGTLFGFSEDDSWYSKLKLLRLIKMGLLSDKHPEPKFRGKVWKAVTKIETSGAFPQELLEIIKENPRYKWIIDNILATHYMHLSRKKTGKERQKLEQESFALALSALEMNPQDTDSIEIMIQSVRRQQQLKPRARTALKEILKSGYKPSWRTLEFLHNLDHEVDPELVSLLEKGGIKKLSVDPVVVTRKHYLHLEKLVRESGARLAVMAYPTTQIDLYKHFFTDHVFEKALARQSMTVRLPTAKIPEKYRHILFIENLNFPYEFEKEIYSDMMIYAPEVKVGFGHTTRKGHELIGKNAAHVLSREWVPDLIKTSR